MTRQNQEVKAAPNEGGIEITPEMIQAGVAAWWAWDGVGMEGAAEVIYAAMEKEARRQARSHSKDR